MPIVKPLKTPEKYQGKLRFRPGPGTMTTDDDFRRPFSDKFRAKSNGWGEKGGRK